MGIDVYMRWKGQTEEEKQLQYTGFSVVHGHVGYLREAYHGEPYATGILLPEGFKANGKPVKIKAAVLRERLPDAMAAAVEREKTVYHNPKADLKSKAAKSFRDFVELAERKEKETGEPVSVVVSA